MTVNINNFDDAGNELAKAISVYADAAREDAALIISSGLTGTDARVSTNSEGFTGLLRWLSYADEVNTIAQPSGTATSTAALGVSNDNFMTVGTYAETYIKNTGVVAAREQSIQSLITRVDGLSYLGQQFGGNRARKEDKNVRDVIKAIGELNFTAPGALAANAAGAKVGLFGYHTGGVAAGGAYNPLFSNETHALQNRSSFFDALLDAMSEVAGEFEESFYYLVISPATFNVLRKQNVLDTNLVQDGNLNVSTLLSGKIRVIVTGNAASLSGTLTDGDNTDPVASYLIKPGALHYSNVAVNNPTAIDTNPLNNAGFGDVAIVSRWANIVHPRGYTYTGSDAAFAGANLGESSSWTRRASNVNQTGIFPIYHGA